MTYSLRPIGALLNLPTAVPAAAVPAAPAKPAAPAATGKPVASLAARFVENARRFLGQPYAWGGGHGATMKQPGPVDASGLVQQAWKAAGVSIPRTSFEMWDALPHISKSQLQPGDLVYFLESGASPSDGPGHVTMYIGNGMMIQATHPGSTVQWSSLDPSSPYYINMTVLGYSGV